MQDAAYDGLLRAAASEDDERAAIAAAEWVSSVTGVSLPTEVDLGYYERLQAWLRSGEVLSLLLRRIDPGTAMPPPAPTATRRSSAPGMVKAQQVRTRHPPHTHTHTDERTRGPTLATPHDAGSHTLPTPPRQSRQMETIGKYIECCSALGVPRHDLFEPIDLYDAKSIKQVVRNLHSLGRTVQSLPSFAGPHLGARLATRNPRTFDPAQLAEAVAMPSRWSSAAAEAGAMVSGTQHSTLSARGASLL